MKRKMTKAELRAWREARRARLHELQRHIARIEDELARKRARPAS